MTVCKRFAPDSLGDDAALCSSCLLDVYEHQDPFAQGWIDGLHGAQKGPETDAWSRLFEKGRKQGAIDKERKAA